ncbi:MAG: hypothetical protein K5780_02880 [Alphaproteobacteria bacterium]|nr:hypothetical protein [Alphaproteobacteria bacterium]
MSRRLRNEKNNISNGDGLLVFQLFRGICKIADNEYVLQHVKASKDLGTYNIGIGRPVAAVDAVYTPTHIFILIS